MSNWGIYIVFLVVLCACKFEKDKKEQKNTPIAIDVWYGDVQEFGTIGLPQKRIQMVS